MNWKCPLYCINKSSWDNDRLNLIPWVSKGKHLRKEVSLWDQSELSTLNNNSLTNHQNEVLSL